MINIIIDHDEKLIEIDRRAFYLPISTMRQVENFILEILNKVSYSGETICVEEKKNGSLEEINRFK